VRVLFLGICLLSFGWTRELIAVDFETAGEYRFALIYPINEATLTLDCLAKASFSPEGDGKDSQSITLFELLKPQAQFSNPVYVCADNESSALRQAEIQVWNELRNRSSIIESATQVFTQDLSTGLGLFVFSVPAVTPLFTYTVTDIKDIECKLRGYEIASIPFVSPDVIPMGRCQQAPSGQLDRANGIRF
jgi:hypothetical protein